MKNVNCAYNYAGGLTGVGTNIISGAAATNTTNVATSFSYRGFGAVKAMTYGNGQALSASYDAKRQQLTNQTWQKSGVGTIVNRDYDYSNGGNNNRRIQKITDKVDSGYTTTYGYDDQNRLTSASAGTSGATYTRSYSYDAWANLAGVAATGVGETSSYSLSYATNASGAPSTNRVSTYTYDAAGNATYAGGPSFAYDAANRIKGVGGNNPREYDGDGRRVRNDEVNAGNIELYYLWSSVLGQVVADLTSGYSTTYGIPFRAYVYSPNGALLGQQSYNTTFTWTHTDHLGSGHKLTDSSGAVVAHDEYDPHGQWVLSVGSASGYYTSHKFTGYERDYAAGSHYAQARQYHHNNARFLQADPLGLGAADLSNPQSLNLYSYVQNDPVNFVDPSGMNREFCFRQYLGTDGEGHELWLSHCFETDDSGSGGSGAGNSDIVDLTGEPPINMGTTAAPCPSKGKSGLGSVFMELNGSAFAGLGGVGAGGTSSLGYFSGFAVAKDGKLAATQGGYASYGGGVALGPSVATYPENKAGDLKMLAIGAGRGISVNIGSSTNSKRSDYEGPGRSLSISFPITVFASASINLGFPATGITPTSQSLGLGLGPGMGLFYTPTQTKAWPKEEDPNLCP